MNARVQIAPQDSNTVALEVWEGIPMECEYAYDPGEPAINDPEYAHPGSPPNATLYGCRIGGVQVIEMLRPEQVERIEDAILEGMQS